MPIRISEEPVQHSKSLEEEPFVQFVGDTDTAEELNRAVLNEPTAVGKLELRSR